ncbi:MAG TPA: hypothetical protein VGK67_28135 [Myxococcales bacterium]|jgi:hypothetical protein
MRASKCLVFALTAAFAGLGCSQGGSQEPPSLCPKAGPVDVLVQAYDFSTKAYQERKVTLTTPTDVCTLQGPVVKFMSGAKFVWDDYREGMTAEVMLAAIRKDSGVPFQVSLEERDWALGPADARSKEALTAYYNFERAFSFFNTIGGLSPSDLPTPFVYYNTGARSDGAYFMSLAQSFLVPPADCFSGIRYLGYAGHLYATAVFYARVHDRQPLPRIVMAWDREPGPTPGMNLVMALEIGQADLFGLGATCTEGFADCDFRLFEDFLRQESSEARRIDAVHCMDGVLKSDLEQLAYGDFRSRCSPSSCPFALGTIFASAVWRAAADEALVAAVGPGEARKLAFRAVWNAETSSTTKGWRELILAAENDQSAFKLADALGAVVDGAADPRLKPALCGAFLDRFGLTLAELPSCPATAVSYGECP